MAASALSTVRQAYEEKRDKLQAGLRHVILSSDFICNEPEDVGRYDALAEEMKLHDTKSTKNVDSLRRFYSFDILPLGCPNAFDLKTQNFANPQFRDALSRWFHVIGWAMQMDLMTPGRCWQQTEEVFESLPLTEVGYWFQWFTEQPWVKMKPVANSELGLPLRTFKALLARLDPQRHAHLCGQIFAFTASIVPLCHASGLNKRSTPNPRQTPKPNISVVAQYTGYISASSATKTPFSTTSYAQLWTSIAQFHDLADSKDIRDDNRLVELDKEITKLLQTLHNAAKNSNPSHPALAASNTSVTASSSSSSMAVDSKSSIQRTTERYLTRPFATHLELMDPTFRLQVLINSLIFLHSISRSSASPIPGAKPVTEKQVSQEGQNLIAGMIKKVEEAIGTSTTYGQLATEALLDMMDTEGRYVDWKVGNCADFEVAVGSVTSSWTPKKRSFSDFIASQSTMAECPHALKEYAIAIKRRKDRPLREGFVGAPNLLRAKQRESMNLGSPSLNGLFNSPIQAAASTPLLDDAFGVGNQVSSWRARRVIVQEENLHAYIRLAGSDQNSEGEPLDLERFVSASNRNFPAEMFVPKPPPVAIVKDECADESSNTTDALPTIAEVPESGEVKEEKMDVDQQPVEAPDSAVTPITPKDQNLDDISETSTAAADSVAVKQEATDEAFVDEELGGMVVD